MNFSSQQLVYNLTDIFRRFGSSLLDCIPKHHGLSSWLYVSILLFLKSSFPLHISLLNPKLQSTLSQVVWIFFCSLFCVFFPFISSPFCGISVRVNKSMSLLPFCLGTGQFARHLRHKQKWVFYGVTESAHAWQVFRSFGKHLRAKLSSPAALSVLEVLQGCCPAVLQSSASPRSFCCTWSTQSGSFLPSFISPLCRDRTIPFLFTARPLSIFKSFLPIELSTVFQ